MQNIDRSNTLFIYYIRFAVSMTEPNKVFRSGCQEDSLYCDGSSSRNFKYRMNSIEKRVKFRSVLKISVYILGFILIALSFIVVGFSLYPNLVGDCKRPVTLVEHQSENETNQHYASILDEVLNGMGICKESNHETLMDKILRLNNNKTESTEIMNGDFLVGRECKCPNSNEDGNKTSDLNGRCICNETHEINYFQTSENYDAYLLNTNNSSHSADFYFNETDIVHETQSVEKNGCNCEKPNKIRNVNMNGTYSEVFDISECKCPEIIEDNMSINDTITESEQHNDKLLAIRECQCPKVGDVNLNRSESDEKIGDVSKESNACFCPEIQEMDDASYRKKTNGGKNHDVVTVSIAEAFDAINSHLSDTETGTERQYLKNECICPQTRSKNGAFLNGTLLNDMHNGESEAVDGCKCPELLEINNFDLNETGSKTEQSDKNSVKLSKWECECPSTINMTGNISSNSNARSHKIGVKTEDGECICPETEESKDFNSRKTINGSTKSNAESLYKENVFNASNFHRNKTRTKKGRKYFKKDKCVCPKAHQNFDIDHNGTRNKNEMRDTESTADDECTCPEILEIDNFDLKETLSKKKMGDIDFSNTEECECPRIPKMLNNGSIIKTKMFGTKTMDGNCVCPEILHEDNIHVNETGSVATASDEPEIVNEKELNYDGKDTVTENFTNGEKEETVNEKEEKNGNKMENSNEKELNIPGEMETLNEKELINGNETETLNGKEMSNDDETEIINGEDLNSDEEIKTEDEKRLINIDETEKVNEKEMINGNETDTVDEKEIIEGDKTEIVKSKELTNDGVTENTNDN